MRIDHAQFVPGPMPDATDGPKVASIDLLTNTIWPFASNKRIAGALEPSGTAAALALSGDRGYWIVAAGPPDYAAPAFPTFRATAAFGERLHEGLYTLAVRAVDDAGHFGPTSTQTLTALVAPSGGALATADLAVVLSWDAEADLDLHVGDPNGSEIYHGDVSSKPEGAAVDGGLYGYLVADSNAGCRLAGRRQEAVVWTQGGPSGAYHARVDTVSLCGQPLVHWTVRVLLHGTEIVRAEGVSLDSDTRGAHDRGAGLLALEFDVP